MQWGVEHVEAVYDLVAQWEEEILRNIASAAHEVPACIDGDSQRTVGNFVLESLVASCGKDPTGGLSTRRVVFMTPITRMHDNKAALYGHLSFVGKNAINIIRSMRATASLCW
jgi:hypothetical protein